MSESLGDLAARKQLLVARSRLHRLEIQHEVRSLRRSLTRPMTALAIAASPSVRPILFSALLLVVGRGRLSRLVRRAMTVLTVVKIVRAGLAMLGRGEGAQRASGGHARP
jgi:hypothetical protein